MIEPRTIAFLREPFRFARRLNGMKTELYETTHESTLARTLAAEDIRRGDVVAVSDVLCEYPSFLWNADANVFPPQEPVCVRWRNKHAGKPLKVVAICLPYVLVKLPDGRHRTLDVRQCRLVRLSDGYARKAWKRLRKAYKKSARTPTPPVSL